jgi:hypothetical protein
MDKLIGQPDRCALPAVVTTGRVKADNSYSLDDTGKSPLRERNEQRRGTVLSL